MTIDLTAPLKLPKYFVDRLKSIDGLCSSLEFSEELVEHSLVYELVKDINHYCKTNRILGFHYTRANPESIRKHGLLIRTGDEVRSKFLEEYSHIFNDEEVEELKTKWSGYFSTNQKSSRDSKIFFNFTLSALGCRGTEYLLGMYGGEQIMMCFDFNCRTGRKLASIGTSMVVHCSLVPSDVRTFITEPWGKIMVSSYHKMINSEAYTIDQDGIQRKPVFPENIIEINALTN